MLSDRCLSVVSCLCLSVLSVPYVALVYCGQTVGWIKMKLGMQVGFGPGHIVLDGIHLSSPKRWGRRPPIFGLYMLWPNDWMDQDATWKGGKPQPKRHCVRCGHSSRSPKRGRSPNFRPMSIVAKWLNGSRYHLERR